jgi:hypothetical protein
MMVCWHGHVITGNVLILTPIRCSDPTRSAEPFLAEMGMDALFRVHRPYAKRSPHSSSWTSQVFPSTRLFSAFVDQKVWFSFPSKTLSNHALLLGGVPVRY